MNRSKGTSTSFRVHELTWMALLVAFAIVISKFSFGSSILQVRFTFIALGIIGYYFGWYKAAIASGVVDLVANTLFASGGTFFFGFTISAVVTGLIFGFMLHNRKVTVLNVFITILLLTVVVDILLNTTWISMMASAPFNVLLVARLPKELIALVYQTGILYFILKWISNSRFSKIGR